MLPIEVKKAGYQTAVIGKWHLKQEPNFDYYKVLPGQGKYFDTELRTQGEKPWPKNVEVHEGKHSSDVITDAALDWFRNERDPNKPFFSAINSRLPTITSKTPHVIRVTWPTWKFRSLRPSTMCRIPGAR